MFAIIVIVNFVLYGVLMYYIGWSGYKAFRLHKHRWIKWLYFIMIFFVSLSFVLSRLRHGAAVFHVVGYYWLSAFSLLLIFVPLTQLIMYILRRTPFNQDKIRVYAISVVLVIVVGGIMYGNYLAYTPKINEYQIKIDKPGPDQMKIVMVSDTHFGYLSGIHHAERLVKKVNELKPDLVLIPGDFIDDELDIVQKKGIFEILQGIESKLGVFGSLGNHDTYQGDKAELIAAIETANINILYDEVYKLTDEIYLIGRKDKSEEVRLSTSELVSGIDPTKVMILLDHQPHEFKESADAGIDLVVAGHTHHGQIFPGSVLTNMVYDNDWGYLLVCQMHSIVSSGYGFWGPPLRLGSQSEIVVIQVEFTG